MNKIPFAEFVLRDIAENGCQIADDVFDGSFICDVRRARSYYGVESKQNKDDWNLDVSFFGLEVTLTRGPECFHIKLTREHKRRLVAAWNKKFAELKQEKLDRKIAKARREREAQEWP